MAFVISSPLFKDGDKIPPRFAADSGNISPAFTWDGAPPEAVTFALVLHDPDASRPGGYTHWLIFNLPRGQNYINEAVLPKETLKNGVVQGRNSAGANGYIGPAPPPGKPHHYHFTLYAVDRRLNLQPSADRDALLEALKGHILAQTEIVGLYQR